MSWPREPGRSAASWPPTRRFTPPMPTLAGRLAWAVHSGTDGTVTVEQTLLDYQRLTQELTPFRPSLFIQGATASEVPDAVLGGLRRPVPRRDLLRRTAPVAAAHGPHPIQRVCPPQPPYVATPWPASSARSSPPSPTATRATRGWDEVLRLRAPGAAGLVHPTVVGAGHFLQEDRGDELADLVSSLVEATTSD